MAQGGQQEKIVCPFREKIRLPWDMVFLGIDVFGRLAALRLRAEKPCGCWVSGDGPDYHFSKKEDLQNA